VFLAYLPLSTEIKIVFVVAGSKEVKGN